MAAAAAGGGGAAARSSERSSASVASGSSSWSTKARRPSVANFVAPPAARDAVCGTSTHTGTITNQSTATTPTTTTAAATDRSSRAADTRRARSGRRRCGVALDDRWRQHCAHRRHRSGSSKRRVAAIGGACGWRQRRVYVVRRLSAVDDRRRQHCAHRRHRRRSCGRVACGELRRV